MTNSHTSVNPGKCLGNDYGLACVYVGSFKVFILGILGAPFARISSRTLPPSSPADTLRRRSPTLCRGYVYVLHLTFTDHGTFPVVQPPAGYDGDPV